jgi:HPt (histidine-containing phosphotransfer) domain-containing protein
MSQRLSDYLARETTDYLDQLDALLAAPAAPEPESLLRLAHGVRGSAQMAGFDTIAGVAERLEDAARSVLSHHVSWSGEIRALAIQTVRDLKLLVRAVNRWGPQEEARVRAALERWDELEHGDDEGVVPIASLFHDDDGPHVVAGATVAAGDAVVPIESLLLRGEGALREALRLRPELERLLRDVPPDAASLLSELFELIELALPDPSPEE